MGDTTISWTNKTWNPVRGCSRVSEGCRNCYAEKVAARFSDFGQPFHLFADRHKSGSKWTGKVELVENMLDLPLHWRKPQKIFVNSMSDLFHEGLSFDAIDRVFAVMALCPQHTFQILTKRPERMLEYFSASRPGIIDDLFLQHNMPVSDWHGSHVCFVQSGGIERWPLNNIWLGVSVEDQTTADARIPLLLQTPAAVRFVSYEPALARVDFTKFLFTGVGSSRLNRLPWLIIGGESGPGARPFDVQWARDTIAQCKAAGVACFVKQLGAKPVRCGAWRGETREMNDCRVLWRIKDRKGGDMSEWPEDLRVREFPGGKV